MPNQAGTILVIEDDPGTASLQRKCLERIGYQVFTADSRSAAWQVLEERPVELILLDYKLQEHETGLDMLRDLQAKGRDIPCIVVTGFGNEQLAIEAFRAGARDFVPKSVTYLDSLPQAVDRVFREIRREEALRRSADDRQRLVHDLGERVKELTLLREVSRLIQDGELSTPALLAKLVEALPSGFQWPEQTTARIRLGAQAWTGGGFQESAAMLRAEVKLSDGRDGSIDIALLQSPPHSSETPFLPEEETLLASIAEMLGVHLDRRQSAEDLRLNEQRYRSLIESSTVVVWTATPDGMLNHISPLLETVNGTEVMQAIGDGWMSMMHPDDLPMVATKWQSSLTSLQPHYVTPRVRRENGDYTHCEIRAVPIFDQEGKVIEWFGTMRDITQERESEAALARLAAIVETSDDAIISTSLSGIVLSWNHGAERTYGYSAEDMLGKSATAMVPAEAIDEWNDILVCIGRGEHVEPFEAVRLRRDGGRIDFLVRVSAIRDSQGRIVAVSWIHHEITERKAAERRRQLQSATLQLLADTASIEDAANKLIEAICEVYGWHGGGLWLLDERDKVLRFAAASFDNDQRLAGYGEYGRQLTFECGAGLPGEAWQSGEPVWVPDFDRQRRYPRAMLARDLKLHTAIGFPLKVGSRTVGVLDFFGPSIARPSSDDLALMSSLSSQFALFVDRRLTEIKRAQLAAILEASTDFVGLTGPGGDLLFLNGAGRRMLGLADDEEVTRLNTWQCVPAWVVDLLRTQAVPQALREGAWTGEAAIWNRRGFETAVSMLLLAHRDSSGEVQFFSMIGRDITEEKQNREALVLHNRAMSATSEGIVITGPAEDDAPILYANEAFLKLTGYKFSQIVGRNCRFLQGPDTDPETVQTIRQSIAAEEPCTVELLNYKADGTAFWNLISITPVRDSAGKVTHFVGTQRDISERKRLEDQVRQKQKMEAIGSLAGGIAHDFNNMLTVILGYSEMARDTLPAESETQGLIDEIVSAAQRAATLTGQLLAFSRRQMIAPQQIDVNAIVSEFQRLLRPLISENIVITHSLAPGLWPVKVDPSQFEQIVMNLVINARDAMPNGGRLSISTENCVLTDNMEPFEPDMRPGDYVALTVADTGCGMSKEVLSRIFEPFFTTKPKAKGTGMGLATVYGIVKQSGGHLMVDSQPEVGTTFRVFLPRESMPEPAQPQPAAPQQPPAAAAIETVLLVEDENAVREFVKQVLDEQGYRVIEATRGDEALDLADAISDEIDALITDVIMPGMGGRQLADKLLQSRPDLRVLYLSGYSDDIVSKHGVLDPGTAFLQKPFNRDSLTRKLRQVLDGQV